MRKPHRPFRRKDLSSGSPVERGSAQTVANYDVSPDGQRFLMVKDDSASGKINIVVNWFEELSRLAPVGQR